MKLIIDISEGSYNTIKECYERGELLTTICMQIATGTPYEERPQGDLISRSEAKKLGATCLARRNENGQLEAIISLENAPTVAVNCKDCDGYEAGYSAGLKDAERPQGELKEYKPLEPDYNVQCAVENLRTAYWSNDSEKYAKAFTEADQMIVSAICHYGYTVCKQPQGEWKVNNYGEHICPKCGKYALYDEESDGQYYEVQSNFCPECGADLKGGAEC